MRFFSPLLILAALLAAACGGAVLPDEFTRERADGKIPVSIPLIREQTQKEIDGMPEGQAKAERWQKIEKDHNQCRLLSARSSRAEANEVFAACMSKRDYLYMHRLDAEQLHDDIAAQMVAKHKAAERAAKEKSEAEKRAAEEALLAAETKRTEAERNVNLLIWAKRGDATIVNILLIAGANANTANEYNQTALMLAASMGHSEVVKMLVDADANPNTARDNGWTALMSAARNGHPEVAKILVASGANVNAVHKDGDTPLMYALKEGHSEVAKILVASGANQDKAKARLAVIRKEEAERIAAERRREAERIAAEKRREEEREKEQAESARKREAARLAYEETYEKRVAQNRKDANLRGWAEDGNISEFQAWLDVGANPNAANEDGGTALMAAAFGGNAEIAKILLAKGANVRAEDNVGNTALMIAAQEGHVEVAKVFLAAGLNANTSDNDGYTALMTAGQGSKYEMVRLLLDCGASMGLKNRHGRSIWVLANERPVIYSILAQHRAQLLAGKRIYSCKNRWPWRADISTSSSVATAKPPSETNVAEAVFENVWRSIVVIRQGERQGSGVIVRPNVVATNCHVVDSYGDIVIYKHNNRRATTDTTYNAVIRHRDNDRDFCLLNVVGLKGNPAKVRRYQTLKIGEDVYAVGSPKGLDLSLSSGIISQLRQGTSTRYIQTDAAISPGSSGGGLFDSDSNFIGILTRKIADEKAEGLGFAIPADLTLDL